MQSKEEIEKAAEFPDHWGFQTNENDLIRKNKIIDTAKFFTPRKEFIRALDIGAHEGWITKDLPANEIYGYELSNNAAARFPSNVKRLGDFDPNVFYFDLVTATGILYNHYDWRSMVDGIHCNAANIIITCNIQDWEYKPAIDRIKCFASQVFEEVFPYREFTQKLRVFKV